MTLRPTHVRYLIVFTVMLAAMLLYLERVCLSVADVYIREDLRIGTMEMDIAFGAFFIAYALGQVPAGWLSQRYGPRLMMTLYLLGWSVFGIFIALAQDIYMLVAARFLLGLSQAGAYPTAVLIVKRWIPDRHRGLASGVVALGGRFGGAGATWLTGLLIIAFVPISTPATLRSEDVVYQTGLKDIAARPPAEVDALEQLPPTNRAYRAIWFRIARELPHLPGDPDSGDFDRQALADLFNRIIRDPHAIKDIDWYRPHLTHDAVRIAAKPPEDRTPAESERLNRLVLEIVLEGAIRSLHSPGWRPTMLVYGLGGIVVGLLFWLVVRNWPWQHPWANTAEVELIESGQSQESQQAGTDAIPWRQLFTSRNQWLYSATNFFSNLGWVFLITLMPRFLYERFQVPLEQRGLMTTLPLIAAAIAVPLGGWTTDRLCRTLGRRWGRAIPMGAFKLPCATVLAIAPWLPDAWTVVAALSLMSVYQDFGLPAVWAFAQDTGGRQSATVLGWANMWGNFGAGIGPVLIGAMSAHVGWDAALYTGACSFLMCGITGVLANADEPLFSTEEEVEA